MNQQVTIEPCLAEAIEKIKDYMIKSRGFSPEPEEIADALTKFFVLKEIGEFIDMQRQNS